MSLKSRMRTATDTTLRHLAMLTAIPARPHSKSTRQIREELRGKDPDFDVSPRTIQRSLEQLSRVFPIASEQRGRANHWYWVERNALTQIPAMSESTAFVLRLAADYLRPIMPPETLRVLDPYFRHAEKILAGTALGSWSDRAAIIAQGLSLTPPTISTDVQESVYEALMKRRKVAVDYRSKHEAESKRIVLNPLGIVVRTGIVYLVATSWKYRDIRHYVLHRMSEPQLTDEPDGDTAGFPAGRPSGRRWPVRVSGQLRQTGATRLVPCRRRSAPDRKPPRSGSPRNPAGRRACAGEGHGGRHRRIAVVAGGVRELGGGAGAGFVAGRVSGGGATACPNLCAG